MGDLQDRCEKVINLEMKLDDTINYYESIISNSASKHQQQKFALAQKNLALLIDDHQQVHTLFIGAKLELNQVNN